MKGSFMLISKLKDYIWTSLDCVGQVAYELNKNKEQVLKIDIILAYTIHKSYICVDFQESTPFGADLFGAIFYSW